MQLLYNSDHFVVMQFDVPAAPTQPARGGYEIVDKFARKEIFLEGEVATRFRQGVQALVDEDPDPERIDAYLAEYTVLAQQTVALH